MDDEVRHRCAKAFHLILVKGLQLTIYLLFALSTGKDRDLVKSLLTLINVYGYDSISIFFSSYIVSTEIYHIFFFYYVSCNVSDKDIIVDSRCFILGW